MLTIFNSKHSFHNMELSGCFISVFGFGLSRCVSTCRVFTIHRLRYLLCVLFFIFYSLGFSFLLFCLVDL